MATTDSIPGTPAAGSVSRQDFSGAELALLGETAATAAAAQAQALVQARYIMALRRPRDMDEVRVRLLQECKRPGFARSAWFMKPIGKGVEGFSIRFAEAAVRCLTNVLSESAVTWDDPQKRVLQVTVTDLESNTPWSKSVTFDKTVERSSLRKGQIAMATRINSSGQPVYIVEATDDEILSKENGLISKAIRNSVLRILPGDIQDECKATIKAILAGEVAKDPDAERKKIADAFAELGVMPSALKDYMGHDLAAASPAELVKLRAIYTGIKTGETTWSEVIDKDTPAPAKESKSALDDLTERLQAQPKG
jgi:hypothetical protein